MKSSTDILQKLIMLICIFISTKLYTAQPSYFSHSQTTTWQEFLTQKTPPQNKKKWVWISRITLKSKKPVKVTRLVLKWNGQKLHHIFASLFQKNKHEKKIVPIEKNLISDGSWNSSTQKIAFHLSEKIVTKEDYYLVLNFPISMEQKLKHGHFSLDDISCQ